MYKSYYLSARLIPTIITSIPLVILANILITRYCSEQLQLVNDFYKAATHTSLSLAVIFLLTLLNRLVAKDVFQRGYFQDKLYMPTTDYLLHTNITYEQSIKASIREKIRVRYNINLLDVETEKRDELRARQLIEAAGSRIRNELRTNKMVLQHNIEYGFFRNILGGSLVAIIPSIGLVAMGASEQKFVWEMTGIIFTLACLITLLLGGTLVKKHSEYYAKMLYEQFLSL